jgi:hypothetical protein
MKEVYYKGQPYNYEVIGLMGQRVYVLYKDGELVEHVKEEELDIRSRVSIILDEYYSLARKNTEPTLLKA